MEFEMKLEKELLEFTPRAVGLFKLAHVECDEGYTVKVYVDPDYSVNMLSVVQSNSKSLDEKGLSRYFYQGLFNGDLILHRIGGPAIYTYDALLNKITHIEFWYKGRKLTEREYWSKMSTLPNLDCYDFDIATNRNNQPLRIDFKASRSAMMPSYYDFRTRKFEYRVNGKKFNRSVFYIQLEQKVRFIKG